MAVLPFKPINSDLHSMICQLSPNQGCPASAVVAEARKWIETPYVHQANLQGVGTDCLGLVRGIWRALYGDEPQPVPPYSPDWGETEAGEPLLTAARDHLAELDREAAGPGNLLIFRMRRRACAKHCAILTDNAHMVHARSGHAVCEVPFSLPWKRRLAAVFCFPSLPEVV